MLPFKKTKYFYINQYPKVSKNRQLMGVNLIR
jgi:hypothetical protein